MKRLPVDSSTPFLSSPNGEQQGPRGGGAGASSTHEPTYNDALAYLVEVKDIFEDNPEKFHLFHKVITDYQDEKIDTTSVVAKVKELLKGYNNLLHGFNIFLPEGYEITVPEADKLPPKRTAKVDSAINFLVKVKERFQNDDHVYETFLDTFMSYKKGDKNIHELYDEVTSLLDGYPDLLSDFDDFLRRK